MSRNRREVVVDGMRRSEGDRRWDNIVELPFFVLLGIVSLNGSRSASANQCSWRVLQDASSFAFLVMSLTLVSASCRLYHILLGYRPNSEDDDG